MDNHQNHGAPWNTCFFGKHYPMILIAIAWKLVVRPDPGPSPPRFSAQLSWCLLGLVRHPSYGPFLANVWHHQWTSKRRALNKNAWPPGMAARHTLKLFDGYLTFKCSQRWKTSYSKGYSIVKGKTWKNSLTSCETWGTPTSQFTSILPVKVAPAVTTAAILRCLYPVIGPLDQHWQRWCWHVQPSNSSTEISPSPSSIIWNLQKWLHCLRCSPCPVKFQD